MDQFTDALQRFFGFEDFLDYQREVVEAVASGKDLCVIMPTGAGKSLCYQLPLLLKPGYGIVVSPLIALMKDQIDSLREKGIAAGAINSAVDYSEQRGLLYDTAQGRIKLLYVAPERFGAESFQRFLAANPPSTLIVDEAHCISQWGHDFRPAYTRLGQVAAQYRIPQVCAFTATATPRVQSDIKFQLGRPEMDFHVAGFKRPNLAFKVVECRGAGTKLDALKRILAAPVPGATLIYCATRKQVEELTGNIHCSGYHAGLSDEVRSRVQDEFMNAPAPVMAATNAFGMGIDRSDVRRVIHYNLTSSLEAYYQEAGRAGRDGEPAECILLFNYADRHVQEFLVELNNPAPETLKRIYKELFRLHAISPSPDGAIEVAPRELASRLDIKSDSEVYTALRVLDHYGIIERGSRRESAGVIQLQGNATLLRQMHESEKTQRSRFINRFLNAYGTKQAKVTFAELENLTGLSNEQLRRVLNFLNGDALLWMPAPPGGAIHLLHPEMETLDIDFTELERKREFELGRLDDVIGFAQTKGCRQAALIGYFGEKSKGWKCGSCDNCDAAARLEARPAHTLTDAERDAVLSMLECISFFNGRFGRGKLSLALVGARRTEILDTALGRSEFFGALRSWKQDEVLDYLRALEKAGYLALTQSDYPCVMLSPDGEAFLANPGEMELALRIEPRQTPVHTKKSPGRRAEKSSAGVSANPGELDRRQLERQDLYDELKALRLEIARRGNLKAFQIFSDAILQELVVKMPMTEEEAAHIKGIGSVRAGRILPPFLEVIAQYRKKKMKDER